LPRTQYTFSKVFGKEVKGVGAKVDVPEHYKLLETPQKLMAKLVLMYHPNKEEYHRLTQLIGEVKSKLRGYLKP
jgi:hypothetical protein